MLEKILQAFDLARRPFGAMPDAKCFFTTAALRDTLSELVLDIERGQGICILTGEAGSGKSLLLERLAIDLKPNFEVVLLRHAKFQSSRAVLQEILSELQCDFEGLDETALRLALRQRVHAVRPEHEAIALIIDEAENFPTDALEELRMLADLAEDGSPLVRLVLCGQWRLEERLTERDFDALNQRVCSHLSLQPLSTSESAAYLRFRLDWAGGDSNAIFTEQALQFVVRAAGGLPRCLNLLADHCLYRSFGQQERPVSAETVRRSLADLKQLPLHWNDLHDLTDFTNNEDETLFEVPVDETVFALAMTAPEERHETSQSDREVRAFEVRETDSAAASSCFEFGAEEVALLQTSSIEQKHDVAETTTSSATVASSDFRSDRDQAAIEFGAPMEDAIHVEASAMSSTDTSVDATSVVPERELNSREAPDHSLSDSSEGCCFTITAPRRSRAIELAEAVETLAQQSTGVEASTQPESLVAQTVAASKMEFAIHSEDGGSSSPETTLTHEEHPVPQFVEEIVVDHYAALQEPEFSGIIWTLARQVSNDGAAEIEDATATTTVDESDNLSDELPRITLGFEEAVRRRDAAIQAVPVAHHDSSREISASDEDEPVDGVIEDIRPLRPNRYLDAIMPLINDVIDPEGDTVLPESNRSRAEIESELLDALTAGEPDAEDLIGSEVLDLCLDAQAAIRQAQDAVAQSLQSQLRAIDPDDDDESLLSEFDSTFDIVEPDDAPVLSAIGKSERRTDSSREQTRDEQGEHPQDDSKRPFRRLFSELRRRQRLVG